MKKKITAAEAYARSASDSIMRAAHMTFNAPRGAMMIKLTIKFLQERLPEIQPKPATPAYKKARYGGTKKKKKITAK